MPSTFPIRFYDPSAEDSGDGDVVLSSDVVAEGLVRLIPEYQETPRIQAWLASFLAQVQALETTAFDVWEIPLSIDLATVDHLDLIGAIVLEPRNGRSDDDYRRALRVRILVNRSQGRTEELIRIAYLFEQIAAEAGASVRIQDVAGPAIEVRVYRTPVSGRDELHARLDRARAAGVGLQTIRHPGGPTGSFRFCLAADYAEKSTTEGFSSLTGVAGGDLADVVS